MSSPQALPPLRLGIAGLGTVGIGTVKIVQRHAELIAARTGRRRRPGWCGWWWKRVEAIFYNFLV